jgi:hypothetical protein
MDAGPMGMSWLSSVAKKFFDDLVSRCGEWFEPVPFGMPARRRIPH